MTHKTDLGHVFWLFGLSGSGKTTLANFLCHELRLHAVSQPFSLDGDRLRLGLCSELGYSEVDRTENLRRASEVARMAIESGIDVVASFITPREFHRQLIQETIGLTNMSLVYVSATLEVCRMRDVKGLYSRAKQGALSHMSGVDSAFDPPTKCDLVLDTVNSAVADSGADLLSFAMQRLRSI